MAIVAALLCNSAVTAADTAMPSTGWSPNAMNA
jgi:hypothetical protein